jgi:hypothetical protein
MLSFFWGDPSPCIEWAHAAGTKVLDQAGSVAASHHSRHKIQKRRWGKHPCPQHEKRIPTASPFPTPFRSRWWHLTQTAIQINEGEWWEAETIYTDHRSEAAYPERALEKRNPSYPLLYPWGLLYRKNPGTEEVVILFRGCLTSEV